MRAAVVVVALVGVGACIPVPTYVVQRSARVPHPAAPLRTGEEMHGPVEVSVGEEVAGEAAQPKLKDSSTAIESPNRQARGELRIRLGQRAELAAIYERALEGSFRPLQPGQAPGIDGTASGGGLAFRYSIPFKEVPEFTLGLAVDAMSWDIPYIEYRSCVANCEGVPVQTTDRGSTSVGSLGLGITPTYRVGNLRMYVGLYMRRHPTIARKGEEYGQVNESDVDGGPNNVIIHAGIEWRHDNFALLVAVDQDANSDPVSYGPTIGFAVSAAIPDKHP